jgi:hypothetical protein
MSARALFAALIMAAFAVRLAAAFALDPAAPFVNTDGDAGWYLVNGYALVTGETMVRGVATDVSRLPTPPVYPIVLGTAQVVFGEDGDAVRAVQALQAVLGALTAAAAFGLAAHMGGSRAGWAAGVLAAFSPAFVLESAQITSETVFMALLIGGLWAYTHALAPATHPLAPAARRRWLWLATSAVLFGLGALTRAQLLAYPLALAVLAASLASFRAARNDRDAGTVPAESRIARFRARFGLSAVFAGVFTLVYLLTLGTWTAYNLARWNRLVIGGEGFAAFVYIGATGWESGRAVDQRLEREGGAADAVPTFAQGAAAAITTDPGAWLSRRAREWSSAVLQPHGTAAFPGESLRALVARWAAEDRTPGGLLALTTADAFWPKLALYVFHYGTIALGIVGGVRAWRAVDGRRTDAMLRRRAPAVVRGLLPLAGYIAYTALLHLVLFALPRYFFPALMVWAVLAGLAFARFRAAEAV